MKETPGPFFRTTRLVNFLICLVIVFGMMLTLAGPTLAQSPYDAVLSQIQSLRQQLHQLLATYNSSSPQARASMDAAMASGMRQALQQTYNSMSATERAALDAESKRLSGMTFPQLMQTASTIPGLVKMVDVLTAGLTNLAGGKTTVTTKPTTTTTKPVTTTKPATTTTKPVVKTTTTYSYPDGAVDIGSGKIKLGWVLYSRTDLSDESAQAIYDGKVAERKTALDKSISTAQDKLAKDKNKLDSFEKGLKDKNLQGIRDTLKNDLTDATKERNQAAADLGTFFLKEFTSKASTTLEKAYALNDVMTGSYDMQTLASKPERTRADWEAAGKGLAGVLTAVAGEAGYATVGPVASSAELLADCIYLHLADANVRGLQNSINQSDTTLANARTRYDLQIQKDTDTLDALSRERNTLTNTNYLDFRP